MSKGAARNMQRISLKIAAGTAPPQNPDVKQAPVYKQVRALELRRLARIRHVFEIEDEVAKKQAAGESVGLLREKLLGVKNGTIEPPDYRDIRPTSDTQRHRSMTPSKPHRDQQKSDGRVRHHRLYRSDREVISDLNDLRKGKLTPTGMATIKGLLDRFDEETVIGALELKAEFVRKVAASALFAMVPAMSPADGILLAGVLEARLPPLPKEDPPDERQPAETAPAQGDAVKAISVDAISGAEYLELRIRGWTISGSWMQPPGSKQTPPSTPDPVPTKKVIETLSAKRPRTAVAPAAKPDKAKKKKGRGRKATKPVAQPRHVPLSAEALARLRSNEAFRTSSAEPPRKIGTITLPPSTRAGFVAPPATPEINWRDESEDGSMWDR
ncbi:hypothetical protein SAMN06295905_3214 [Devosia lucknowensis]|uniref:Uncharacterized protein n=1 Tax=Devosia lucknowensis TaxID=1096929 RepID=A0A1Y6GCW8_9HYPH|nr:hypothetical protein [Devosia lucknowensis]SMQ85919.1 hypothetical protein SAMN06295905_3214 [Devosia lucknowensis]